MRKSVIANTISTIRAFYSPSYPCFLINAMEGSGYRASEYLVWFWVHQEDSGVRAKVVAPKGPAVQIMVRWLSFGMLAQIAAGLYLFIDGLLHQPSGLMYFGLALILIYPLIWAHIVLLAVPLHRINHRHHAAR